MASPVIESCSDLPTQRLRDICEGTATGVPLDGPNSTNAYRKSWGMQPIEWTVSMKSRGVGDIIAKVTHATGIDRVVKAVAGGDCGCKKRQKSLNETFPL